MREREVQFYLGVLGIVGAVVLLLADKEGWGWLILLAFLCIPGCLA